jgi:hypothetical protein
MLSKFRLVTIPHLPSPPKGKIFSEGNNDQGQLGQGDNQQRTTFTEITSIPTNITFISSGYYHTLALDENSDVWSWGLNSSGQLGLEHNNDQPTPTKSSFPLPSPRFLLGATQQLSQKREFFSSGDIRVTDRLGWDPQTTKTPHNNFHFPKKSFISLVAAFTFWP